MIIGIDIGGTKINFACVEDTKVVEDIFSLKTPDTAAGIMDAFCLGIQELLKKCTPKAIGLSTAGTVDLNNSRVTGSTGNLPKGYKDLKIKKILEEKFKLPVYIENDANAAAYAEYKAGNAIGHKNTITITLGTGIGGGIIVEGKILKGRTGAGAEVGHIPMTHEKKRKCTCGSWDCWESYGSGTGYAITARELAAEIPEDARQGILKNKDISKLTTYDVIAGLKDNDPFAIKVHGLWEEYLSMGMAALINIFEPDSLILSGGMAKCIDYDVLHKKVQDRVVIAETQILPAKFENLAGALGAAYLAEETL